MATVMGFDEINKLVGYERSIPIDEYFSGMEISEKQKRFRILLARELEDEFITIMILILTMKQYRKFDWDYVEDAVVQGYKNAIEKHIDIDTILTTYILEFARKFVDTTIRHIDDPYYYSGDRARLNSENESNTIWNYDEYTDALTKYSWKQWLTAKDDRVRETHQAVDDMIIPIANTFQVGGSLMRFPKDVSLGASPDEIVGCRCSVAYFN